MSIFFEAILSHFKIKILSHLMMTNTNVTSSYLIKLWQLVVDFIIPSHMFIPSFAIILDYITLL